MALPKRTKEGGIFYKGYKLDVLSSTGDYIIALNPSATNCAVNGVSITPDSRGVGDTFSVAHYDNTATTGGKLIKQIATGVYNIGGGITISLDFAAMQMMNPNESLRFVYSNVASVAMPVYITVEAIK